MGERGEVKEEEGGGGEESHICFSHIVLCAADMMSTGLI